MFQKFFPTFKSIGGGNLTGLRNGHMLAQSPAYAENDSTTNFDLVASKTVGDYKFIENGIIVGLGSDGVIKNYDAEAHPVPFLHFTEELVTGPLDGNNQFAVETTKGKPSYPRCIALYVGDSFITDNYAGTPGTGVKNYGVVNGILTADVAGGFIGKATKMANGTPAVEFTYVGQVVAEVDFTDAPTTAGKLYVRQAGAWVDISGAFLTDVAEGDPAKTYGRKDGEWVEIPEGGVTE